MKNENFWFALAFLLPKKLVYFAFVRLVAVTTTGEYSDTVVPELTCVEALQRWGRMLGI